MTTEEKAKDIARKWYHDNAPDTAYRAAIQMAKWKEEQMIDKAIMWLNDWFTDDSCGCGIPITKTAREDFFNDFRNDMKEE